MKIITLFSDIVMPGGMNGYELARRFHKEYPQCRILLTSDFTNKREEYIGGKNVYLSHIASNLLCEPYNKNELAQVIRQILDKEI